jgi:serine/threonine protein kinase
MDFPSITEYVQVINHIKTRGDKLQNFKSIRNDNFGRPIGSAGKFATVFKMEDLATNKKYALKCFIRENVERKERYEAISKFIKNNPSIYFCDYEYIDKELAITPQGTKQEELYPVVKMEWVEGETLGVYLQNNCSNISNKSKLETLYKNWRELINTTYHLGFAHGDLKHDNMIVLPNSEIKLIDYDGMFVPALKGRDALEEGSQNYQHPKRYNKVFDLRIDYFPHLIISISLKALSINPSLYSLYANGENLLFMSNDFVNLQNSKIFKDLKSLKDSIIDELLQELEKSLKDINYTPNIYNSNQSSNIQQLSNKIAKLELELQAEKSKVINLQNELNSLNASFSNLTSELTIIKNSISNSNVQNQLTQVEIASKTITIGNLMFQDADLPNAMNWNDACKYCENLRLLGFSDWRLPTIEELRIAYQHKSEFRNMQNARYWSISKYNTSDFWELIFSVGDDYYGDQSYSSLFRCVRNNQ